MWLKVVAVTSEKHKNLNQDSQSLDQELNMGLSNYSVTANHFSMTFHSRA
jgi:hypothetical protein